MHAEEVDKPGDVVRAKWPMGNFLSTGPDNDRMSLVVAANAFDDQLRPVDCHRVSGLRVNDPKWRLVGKIPCNNRAFVGVAAAKLGSEVGFKAQHVRISMRMSAMPPGHIPISLANLSPDEEAGMKIDFVFMS